MMVIICIVRDYESRKKLGEPAKWFARVPSHRYDLTEWPIQDFKKREGGWIKF